jgi:replicative DNA helicase
MPGRADISPLTLLLKRIDAIADGDTPPDGVPTGFPTLDRLLAGGLRPGDLVVLGGDVGVGKSALAIAMALHARQAGHQVAYFSGEMDATRWLERALAIEGKVSMDLIRRGKVNDDERSALGAAALRLRDAIPRISHIAPEGAAALAEAIRQDGDAGLVVVDSLQCVPAGDAPREDALAFAVRVLKSLAVERQTIVLLVAHLSTITTRTDMRPVLDDFGALGAVKQHADVILALYREELYVRAPGREGATELAILKNREGPMTYLDLYFYKQWLRFEDMVEA